jgi:hypothetical protein
MNGSATVPASCGGIVCLAIGMLFGCTGQLAPGGAPGGSVTGSGVGGTHGSGGSGAASLDCSQPHAPRAPLRRLTRFEYNNTVRDLPLAADAPADALPGEEAGNGFGNDADALGVSPLLIEGYLKVAQQIAQAVAASSTVAGLPSCDVAALGAAACGAAFVESFVTLAFRRPLEPREVTVFNDVFNHGLQVGGSYEAGVSDVIEATLQAPQFLYRIELGEPTETPGVARPTDYEMAVRLSYLLWGSTPDAPLLEAAKQGQLRTKEQLAQQAMRLLADARARDVVRFFHGQWLGIRGLDSLVRNETYYPTFQPGMGRLFRQETELFVDSVIFGGAGNLKGLYGADHTFVNGPLAQFYGIPGVTGDDFRRVPLDTTQRTGLLTHASVLAKTTPGSRTDPVVRGKWAFSNLLCGIVPDPPPGVAQLPDPTPGVSVQQRLAQHREVEPCRTCHLDMDPLGFAFEHFDGVGLWREMDNGVPVDASAEIHKTDAKGTFNGVLELSERLAGSLDAQHCYVGKWLTYAYGRVESEADICTRQSLEQAFQEGSGNVQQLLVALTQTEAFLYRPDMPAGGLP